MGINQYRLFSVSPAQADAQGLALVGIKPEKVDQRVGEVDIIVACSTAADSTAAPTSNPDGAIRLYTAWEKDGPYYEAVGLNAALDAVSPGGDNALISAMIRLSVPGVYVKARYVWMAGGANTDIVNLWLKPRLPI